MFRNMITSFLNHERITTTDAKAKELRSIADKMISLGKRGDLHAMRQAASYIREKSVVTKLFTTIAPRYTDRPGGYTRIVKLGLRPGDNAQLSMIELVEESFTPKVKKTVAPTQSASAVKSVQAEAPLVAAAETAGDEQPVIAADFPQTKIDDTSEACEAKAD
jgi:large subunit ribosomal protein L17